MGIDAIGGSGSSARTVPQSPYPTQADRVQYAEAESAKNQDRINGALRTAQDERDAAARGAKKVQEEQQQSAGTGTGIREMAARLKIDAPPVPPLPKTGGVAEAGQDPDSQPTVVQERIKEGKKIAVSRILDAQAVQAEVMKAASPFNQIA